MIASHDCYTVKGFLARLCGTVPLIPNTYKAWQRFSFAHSATDFTHALPPKSV